MYLPILDMRFDMSDNVLYYIHKTFFFLLKNYSSSEVINIGTGQEVSISKLSKKIAHAVNFKGEIIFDDSKPDGAPRKVLDITKLNKMGWNTNTSLEEGLKNTYEWFINNYA